MAVGKKTYKVPPLQSMSDEHIMKHLELRHPDDLSIEFSVLPGENGRRLMARSTWIAYHDMLHRLDLNGKYDDHYHRQYVGEPPPKIDRFP